MIDYGKELQKSYDDGYKDRDAEIVRCKDCKWYMQEEKQTWCDALSLAMIKPDWFCADGKVANVKDEDNKTSGDVKNG